MSRSRRIRAHESPQPGLTRLAERIPGLAASAFALGLLLLASAPPALAITVTVPDDFATIQQAIDSGANEILIRSGTYAETPVITDIPPDPGGPFADDLVIRGLVPAGASPDSRPVVAGLIFDDFWRDSYYFSHSPSVLTSDIRFSKVVQNKFDTSPFSNPLEMVFTHCDFDSGLTDVNATVSGQIEYTLHDCRIDGPISMGYADRIWIDASLVRQPITMTALAYRLSWFTLTSSRVSGSGAIGLDISHWAENVIIRGNTFEGYEVPIQYFGWGTFELNQNTFTGPGRYAIHAQYDAYLSHNTIVGFDVGLLMEGGDGFVDLLDNRIEHCATAGAKVDAVDIQCERDTVISCGTGMALSAYYGPTVRDNVVRSCSSDGMSIRGGYEPVITSNVVGHCGGNGITATLASPYEKPVVFVKNTSYLNGASGYSVVVSGATGSNELDHNIAFGNGAYGMRVTTTDPLALACNDWFANASGATDGIAPSTSDLAVDPRFCDATNDDVKLAADSPLLVAPDCGLIGAQGQGCEAAPMAIAFVLTPRTLSLASRGHWVTGFLEPASPVAARDIDVASIRLSGTVPVDPAAPTALADHDGDGIPDLMVKFDRVALELTLSEGDDVPVSVTGTVGGRSIIGSSTIRVHRAVVSAPAAGSHLAAGSVANVRWQTPSGVTAGSVSVLQSLDGGNSWVVVARGQPNTGSYEWRVPDHQADRAKVALVLTGPADESGDVLETALGVSELFAVEGVLGVGNRGTAPIALAIRRVAPNPAIGGRLGVEFSLRDGTEARLELLDVAGRVLTSKEVGALGSGAHALDLAEGGELRPGIYFIRLTQGGSVVRARAAIVR